ncbi:MAG: anthranilate synthase component II [Schleiferiaceae bacterium]
MMKVLLIDNYDSFTYNLVHYLEKLQVDVTVVRNDKTLPSLELFDGLVLSPGPGLPKESGQLMPILKKAFGNIPILGICLGMQALAEHCGASLYNRKGVMHGRTVQLENIKPSILLNGLEAKTVGLYHSWAVNAESLGEDWCICATAMDDFAPMVMENSQKKAFAVQFHPESILTTDGFKVIENWVKTIA